MRYQYKITRDLRYTNDMFTMLLKNNNTPYIECFSNFYLKRLEHIIQLSNENNNQKNR